MTDNRITGNNFFGKDYAAEYEQYGANVRKTVSSSPYITVPIGQTKSRTTDMIGLGVEREEVEEAAVEEAVTEEGTAEECVTEETQDQETFKRQYSTRRDRKNAKKQAAQQFLEYGRADGTEVTTEKEAKKLARKYVNNLRHQEEVEGTEVFIDKDECNQAKQKAKEEHGQRVQENRQNGMSRKEANREASRYDVDYNYLKGKKTREYASQFTDEEGNFSSDKLKEKSVEFANINTTEGEETNYHLSLKERRDAAEQEGVSTKVIKNVSKGYNVDTERDNTNLYRGLYVTGATIIGAVIGGATGSSVNKTVVDTVNLTQKVTNNNHNIIKDEAGNILYEDHTTDTQEQTDSHKIPHKSNYTAEGAISGGLLFGGIAAGTMHFIKDKGNKEPEVYAPGTAPSEDTVPQLDEQPPVQSDQPVIPPTQSDDEVPPCETDFTESNYCDYTVQKGDYWAGVIQGKTTVNGKKPEGKVLTALVHATKIKHGVTDFSQNTMPKVGETMRLYTDFSDLFEDEECMSKCPELKQLEGADIQINCDGKVENKSTGTTGKTFVRWTGFADETNKYKQDCDDNMPVRINNLR